MFPNPGSGINLCDSLRHLFPNLTDHAWPADRLPTDSCHTQPKGSSFNDENKEFIRFTLGKDLYIPAFEEAIKTMKVRE